jgi:hypothetical protein
MPYTKEQIQTRYDKLPADIREAIDSVSTTNAVVDIGQKYDLMYDQISELVDEVGLTMIGLTPETMFVNNIARRMRVDMSKAMLIARDTNKQIFDKMRDSLKKIEGGHEGGEYAENEDGTRKNNQFGQGVARQAGEETMMTDAEKAQKNSVVSAVEKAGGFVIDKPREDAPLRAEEMVHDTLKKNLESKKDIINVLEKETFVPKEKTEPPMAPDHLLGDTPEVPIPLKPTSTKQDQTQQSRQNNVPEKTVPKQPDQSSIVDTLLSHGVAMTMEEPSKQGTDSTKPKIRPYDGTDPYRETIS